MGRSVALVESMKKATKAKLKDYTVAAVACVFTLLAVGTVMCGCYYVLFDLASAIGGNPP